MSTVRLAHSRGDLNLNRQCIVHGSLAFKKNLLYPTNAEATLQTTGQSLEHVNTNEKIISQIAHGEPRAGLWISVELQ
jgi:hypothetical protein